MWLIEKTKFVKTCLYIHYLIEHLNSGEFWVHWMNTFILYIPFVYCLLIVCRTGLQNICVMLRSHLCINPNSLLKCTSNSSTAGDVHFCSMECVHKFASQSGLLKCCRLIWLKMCVTMDFLLKVWKQWLLLWRKKGDIPITYQ